MSNKVQWWNFPSYEIFRKRSSWSDIIGNYKCQVYISYSPMMQSKIELCMKIFLNTKSVVDQEVVLQLKRELHAVGEYEKEIQNWYEESTKKMHHLWEKFIQEKYLRKTYLEGDEY